MLLLRFNGQNVDIDEDTAIGINLQAYDIKTLTPQKVSYSNNFTLPKTNNNSKILGWAGSPESKNLLCYDTVVVDYWIDNYQIIKGGTARITAIRDRIELFITSKSDIWDELKSVSWPQFQSNFLTWLELPTEAAPYVGTYAAFINYLQTTDLLLPHYFGNLLQYDLGGAYAENTTDIYLRHDGYNGGHFCAKYKKIFEYIEELFTVNFGTAETFDYNLFEDVIGSALFTPLKNVSINNIGGGWFVEYTEDVFYPLSITQAQADKTLYDCVKGYLVCFNTLVDYNIQEDRYYLRRFDEIANAEAKDFSSLTGEYEFYPTQEGLKQNNYILFEKVYEGGNSLVNAKKIICKNKNLEKGTPAETLFLLDGYVNAKINTGGNDVADLSPATAFETFSLLITDAAVANINVNTRVGGTEYTTTETLSVAKMYGINNEYLGLEQILEYPAIYKVKKWLTLYDVINFQFFKKFWITELNGYFFVNKITGYNPQKSQEPTTIELVKLP